MKRCSTSLISRKCKSKPQWDITSPLSEWPLQRRQITSAGKDVEKSELSYCWWECKLVQPLWKTVWRFLTKLKIELPHDPAIPLLNTYAKKTNTIIKKDICTPMFTAVFFTIAKIWKQPKCPSIDEWIKKMWYIYTTEYYSTIKRMKICHLQQHGWTWRILC